MDLIFKRYSSPYFLDLTIENSELSELIEMLITKQDEEKLWEMYLSTAVFNEKSFEEWKKDVMGQDRRNVRAMSMAEKNMIIEESKNILSGFKPPQKGGKNA